MADTTPALPRPTEIHGVLKRQYRAALQMMQQAIERCPEALWLASEGYACPYWRVVFHGLFFTHFYLQKDPDSMRRWAKHRGQLQDTCGPASTEPYTRAEMLEYLEFCRGILDAAVAALDLSSPDCGFPWYKQGKLEHQLTNLRHLQHHVAQLDERLCSVSGEGVDWL